MTQVKVPEDKIITNSLCSDLFDLSQLRYMFMISFINRRAFIAVRNNRYLKEDKVYLKNLPHFFLDFRIDQIEELTCCHLT